jgi:hypothetical protein
MSRGFPLDIFIFFSIVYESGREHLPLKKRGGKMNTTLKISVVSLITILLFPLICVSKDSGVLIGLRYNENGEICYKTLWVTDEQGKISISGEGSDLLVPRKDGFWRVGVTKKVAGDCEEDFVWGAPVSEKPFIGDIEKEDVENCEMVSTSTILFVGNELISIEHSTSGYCEGAAHPWDASWLSVYQIDSVGGDPKLVTIKDVFGDHGFSEMMKGAAKFLSSLDEEDREALESEPDECRWGLIRRKGKWVVRGRLGYSYEVYRGLYGDFDIDVIPPKTLVSHDELCLSWSKIKERVPDAIDGFSSPTEEMVVVFTTSKILVFNSENGQLKDAILEMKIDKGTCAVMIQWAVGTHVDRWTEMCEDYFNY